MLRSAPSPSPDAGTAGRPSPLDHARRRLVRRLPSGGAVIRRAPIQLIRHRVAATPGAGDATVLRRTEPDVPTSAGEPPQTPAQAFAAELARHRTERPRPIPVGYRPLATAIVGDRPVRVSTGVASRRALATVGKIAATTGDTIHLARPAPPVEVIAHELTHVAHPSPVARFFDDEDHSPEERRAEQVAAIMRRAPVLPSATAAAGSTIRRRASAPTAAPAMSAPGTLNADELAARLTGSPEATIRRRIGGHRTRPATAPPALANAPRLATDAAANTPLTQPAVTIDEPVAGDPATPDLSQQFEYILELLEARILRELERRGGRFRGGF